MADKTEGSISIDADPATIMGVITDFEAYPQWSSGVKKVEIREVGPDGRALKVYLEVSAAPLPLNPKYTLQYEYDGDTSVSWRMIEGSQIKSLEGEYVLEPMGETTKVTYRAAADLGVPMLGFMKRQGEKVVIDTALKGLKKRVESLG